MKKITPLQAACLLACSVSLSAAQAQSAPPAIPPIDTPEIIVTASRSEQVLQTTPVGATVLTAEQIKDSGAFDANEAIRKLTGIAARTDLNGGRDYALDIRGFGETATANTVVLIDGVRISENELVGVRLSAISASSIERIEILRGSAAVVWGEGASGGVINVILKKTTKQGVQGQAIASVESFSTRDVQAGVQVGGGGEKVKTTFDLNARNFSTNGYRENGANKQKIFTMGLGAALGDLAFRLRVHNDRQDSGLPGALNNAQFLQNPRQTTKPFDSGMNEETRVSGAVEYTGKNWTATLDVARRERTAKANYYTAGAISYAAASASNSTQLSPKLNFKNDIFGSAIATTLGSDHTRWNYRNTSVGTPPANNETGLQTNHALFFTNDVLLPTQTRVVWGWRKEAVTKSAIDPVNAVNNVDPGKALNARELSLNQTIQKGVDVYVRTATSFRVANIDERRFLATPLKPQTSADEEVGLKLRGDMVTMAVRYFVQRTSNEISYDPTAGGGFGANVNLDKTRRNGNEIEGQIKLAPELSISGAVQSLNAVFDSGANVGKRVPMVADRTAVLRTAYQFNPKHKMEVSARHLGNSLISNDNANTCAAQIPSNRIYDLSYRWFETRYEVGITMNNVFDQKSYSSAYSCTSGNVYPDAGRSVKATVKYNF